MGDVWDCMYKFRTRCEVRVWACSALSNGEIRSRFVFGMRSAVNCAVPTARPVKTCANGNRWKLGNNKCKHLFLCGHQSIQTELTTLHLRQRVCSERQERRIGANFFIPTLPMPQSAHVGASVCACWYEVVYVRVCVRLCVCVCVCDMMQSEACNNTSEVESL